MTRDELRSALDRLLGISSPERILRELNSSIARRRANHPNAMRQLRASDLDATGNMFRQLRTATAKSSSRR